jgi:hypothetical protein
VAGLHDLGLDADGGAADVGHDVELVDVEAESVELLDPLLDAPHVVDVELLGGRQRVPQAGVTLDDAVNQLQRVELGVEQTAGLQVEQLAEDVRPEDVQVVGALPVRQLVVQLAGLGVDQVGGQVTGASPEQGVRQRAVAPVEALQVQAAPSDHQRIENSLQRVVLESVA